MNLVKQKRNRGVILTAQGLEELKAARINWERKHNFGERYTYENISELTNLDINTIKKILDGKSKVDKRSLEKFFFAFNLNLDSQFYTKFLPKTRQDWGEAISLDNFFGRTKELETLNDWAMNDRCRLIALQGMGGMGKTTLTLKFAQQSLNNFDCVIWKSLRDAPPLENILGRAIEFLSEGREIERNLPQRTSERITHLISYLRSQRCLIVLDNAESVLESNSRAGRYLQGYEGYGELITRLGTTAHNSCIIVTTREKPKEIAVLEGENLPVRSLLLGGCEAASSGIFKLKGLEASTLELNALRDRYGGNPLALKVVATTIQDLFSGNIAKFLAQDITVFGDIRDLLEQQFERLSDLEREIMYWLAISREPVSLEKLHQDLVKPRSHIKLLEGLESLSRRSLIEKNTTKFTEQPVVMEYVTSRLIETITQEIANRQPKLLNNYPLREATAKEYVAENQSRLILQPLIRELEAVFDSREDLTNCLNQIVLDLQTYIRKPGYAAGNIINLLCQMAIDLTGYDFSNLCVWQADLRQAQLHNVSFHNADLSQSLFAEKFGGIWSVAFSPNGQYLAAGDTKGDIILRRMSDGLVIRRFTGHSGWVVSLDFSPDGNTLASSSCDCTVKLWDVQTSLCLRSLEKHQQEVWSIAFSPDGKYLASGCDDARARLWSVDTGECIQVFSGHSSEVLSVIFSPDGQQLITGSQDSTIRFWKIETGKCQRIFQGHEDGVRSLSLNPDGQYLASGSCDRTIRVWDINTEECILVFDGHKNVVLCVNFAPQSNILVSSSIDRTVRLWNVDRKECLQILHGHKNVINSAAFNPNGDLLASGSYDQTIKLWTADTKECLKTWQGYSNQILSVSFSPDSQTFVSGGHDRQVRVWNSKTGKVIKTFQGHSDWVCSTIFSPNGKLIASSSGDKTVKLWDLRSGKAIETLSGHEAAIRTIGFSQDGRILASGSDDCTIKIWNIQTREILHTLTGHKGEIWSIAFSPDDKILASASFDCTVKLWDVNTGECLNTLRGHNSWVWSISFSPDNQILTSASADRTIKFWNLETGECQKTWQNNIGNAQLIAHSSDGETIISCNQDNKIKFWQVITGECLNVLSQHQALITSIDLSFDGEYLISSSEDETIKLWSLKKLDLVEIFTLQNPYQSMNISEIKGLTLSNINTLKLLGASQYRSVNN